MKQAVVVFRLAGREYALDVMHVREVVRMVSLTPLLESPPEILGAINIHGSPILVLDLRQRLGLPVQLPGPDSPLLIVETAAGRVAALVDAVQGVAYIKEPPDAAGLIRLNDRLVTWLQPGVLFSGPIVPLLKQGEG